MTDDLTIPQDLARELFEVVREANRLDREGGTVEERATFFARKDALLEQVEQVEAQAAQRAAQRAHAALCARGTVHCSDYPLCNHSEAAD